MRSITTAFLLAALAVPGSASADVVSAGTNAFHIRHEVPLVVDAARAFDLLSRPADWWSGEHSYSGDAANLSLELRPGGCFCERWEGNFVEHMAVVAVTAGEQITLEGGLGPLRHAPASGTMVWTVQPGGTGAILTLDYKVTGFAASDAERWSSAVDGVLAEQAMRFRAAAARMPRR